MTNSFTIKAKLGSLNDYINACRSNKFVGAKFKSETENTIKWFIRYALNINQLRPITEPCDIFVTYYEKTKKRDIDNVQSSFKFIGDSLVAMAILPDDGQKWVKNIYQVVKSADSDYVVVQLFKANSIKLVVDNNWQQV